MLMKELDRLPPDRRPTWAEIRLDHLLHNFQAIRAHVGTGVKVCAVVKADAYGHGAMRISRCLELAGADWFGVALVEEGVALREGGISRPILCFGVASGQEDLVCEYGLTPVVFDVALVERLEARARARQMVLAYHVEVDTGMGRVGLPLGELDRFLTHVERLTHVRLEGVMTHLAAAEDPARTEFTRHQIARFWHAVRKIEERGFRPLYRHLANSAALWAYPEAWGNMVRPGGLLYGLWRSPLPAEASRPGPIRRPLGVRPILSWHTRIVFLKDVEAGTPLGYGGTFVTARPSRIATLPIGYHDGYRRALSNRGRVWVRGRFAPVVGVVSMDWTLVDVTDIPDAQVGDEVLVLGEPIPAEEIAELCGTISYEITCGIGPRVPRVVVSSMRSPAADRDTVC